MVGAYPGDSFPKLTRVTEQSRYTVKTSRRRRYSLQQNTKGNTGGEDQNNFFVVLPDMTCHHTAALNPDRTHGSSFTKIAPLPSFGRHTPDLIDASYKRQMLCVMIYHTPKAGSTR